MSKVFVIEYFGHCILTPLAEMRNQPQPQPQSFSLLLALVAIMKFQASGINI